MVLVHVHRFPNKQNHTRAIYPNDIKRPMRNPPNDINRSTRNPSKRNRRGGACVPARTSAQRRFHTKNTRIVHGILTMDAPLQGDTGGHTGTAPTKLHHIFPHNSTQTKQPFTHNPPNDINRSMRNPSLPISIKPHGVPLPRSGYTFDSAGLASATQPTLGNDVRDKATPLGVVLFPPHCFLISSHTHTSGAEMHRALPPPFFKTSCVCKLASR